MNYILRDENSIYYECGYSNDNSLYLKIGSECYFFTDGRYELEAKEAVDRCEIIISKDLIKSCASLLQGVDKVTIDPKEWDIFSYNKLKELFEGDIIFQKELSWDKRVIKSDYEISLIKRAVEIGKDSFDKIANEIREDLSEKRLNFLAESIFRDYGNRDISFEPILAINENSAKPHAKATSKILKKGDLILLDGGVKYKRYCSDRTRVAIFNEDFNFNLDQRFSNLKLQKIYDIVLKAHDRAIEMAREGMRACDIDKIARDVIEESGYGKYFVHSTGHGVGLDIHERPFISSKSKEVIKENMVFTIEPGIYLPGEFGIRIEDMVVVKNSRLEIL